MPEAISETQKRYSGKISPLWVVAAFVTLTEVTLGVAITQVTGGVQVALTVFVMLFASVIAGAFFMILWHRPYVFYSPSDFDGTTPKDFIEAMRQGIPDRVKEQKAMVSAVERDPENAEAKFKLIDSLIDDEIRQHLILMKEKGIDLPYGGFYGPKFELGGERHWQSGMFDGAKFAKTLAGTNIVELTMDGPALHLTDFGAKFAEWLLANDRKCAYYQSDFGTWGERVLPPGAPMDFVRHMMGDDAPPERQTVVPAESPTQDSGTEQQAEPCDPTEPGLHGFTNR